MFTSKQQDIVNQAISILEQSHQKNALEITSAKSAVDFCKLQIAAKEHEVFAVLFLNSQHKLISFESMFRGTINAASVYPREVAKRALELNAAAVIYTHNHPSGNAQPSNADISITNHLKSALELLDVNTLDHIIVTKVSHTSFAERGLL